MDTHDVTDEARNFKVLLAMYKFEVTVNSWKEKMAPWGCECEALPTMLHI